MIPIRRLLQRELLAFLLALAGVSALLVWWGVGRVLDQQIRARATESLDRVAGDLNHDLESVERFARGVELLWQQGGISVSDLPAAERTLTPLLEPCGEISSVVFISNEGWGLTLTRQDGRVSAYHLDARLPQALRRDLRVNGQRVQAPWHPSPYRVHERPWFQEVQKLRTSAWAEPYRFVNIPQQGFSYLVPLRDAAGAFRGAVCVDILMDTLSQRVRATEPTQGSHVLMVDQIRRALILPKGMTIPRSKANPLASYREIGTDYLPLFHRVLRDWEALGAPYLPFHVNHEGGWTTAVRGLGPIPWRLILVVPDRDYLGPARNMALVLVALGLLTTFAAGWRLVWFSRAMSAPLEALSASAAALGEGQTPPPVATEVKELRQLDEALQQAAATLAREADLRLQLGHSQRVETLGALAGGIAHDVNNQLAAIVGQIYLARTRLSDDHPALARLDRAEDAAQRCSRTLRALLAFSRKSTSERGPLDLNDLVRHTAQLLEPLLGGHVDVELRLTPGLPAVLGDTVSLEQVLMNLGVNARDAMPGGGRLVVETSHGPNNQVGLSVTDSGSGIPEEVLPRIFEPFFTTKEVGKGTGLGLAMVQSIVEAHGGQIRVETQTGKGSTFHIALPATEPAPRAGSLSEQPQEMDLPGRRVLVVDDDPHLRELMMDVFIQKRAHVEGVPDGMQAWALVQALEYDLVVTDHRMPFMTGLELVENIRQSGRNVPIILVSGFGLEGRERELREDPRLRLLAKPFSLLTLFKVAQELINAPKS